MFKYLFPLDFNFSSNVNFAGASKGYWEPPIKLDVHEGSRRNDDSRQQLLHDIKIKFTKILVFSKKIVIFYNKFELRRGYLAGKRFLSPKRIKILFNYGCLVDSFLLSMI